MTKTLGGHIVEFNKTQLLATARGIKCDGKHCDGKILPDQKYWRAGKKSGMRVCQQCFGFMLSRYSMNDNGFFMYNPFDIDTKDEFWKLFYDTEIVNKLMEAIYV